MTLSTINTITCEFNSTAAALQFANSRGCQHHLLRTDKLVLTKDGLLTHHGGTQTAFEGLPLTDIALEHLNSLVGIPSSYARRLDNPLHAHNINQLIHQMDASVTVVVTFDKNNPEKKHIEAIRPGGCFGIKDAVILQELENADVASKIRFSPGAMEIDFGTPDILEVFSEDYVQLTGKIQNIRWGQKASTRASLEASVFWLRRICTNGAYLQRNLGTGRLMQLASHQQAAQFVAQQIQKIQTFEKTVLLSAVKTMNQTIPSDSEHQHIERLISRAIGQETTEQLLSSAVTWWDEFNAVTAAANQGLSENKSRQLQIEGGAILEKFLAY